MCLEEAGVGELVSHCETKYVFMTSLVPVGNRIYHQGGSGCRSHGSCLDGIEPDARQMAWAWLLVTNHLFVKLCSLSGTGLATKFTTRGGRVQDSRELLCGIKPVMRDNDVC